MNGRGEGFEHQWLGPVCTACGADAYTNRAKEPCPVPPLVPVSEVEKARADERAKVVSEVVGFLRTGAYGEDDPLARHTRRCAKAIEARFAPGTGDDERATS